MSTVAPIRTVDEAKRQLTRIRLTAGIVRDNLPRLWELVQEAKSNGDDSILGYASWTAYVSDAFSDEPMRLPRDDRQQLVAMLSGEGMSTRAIAPIVGVSKDTVQRDLAGVSDETPVADELSGFRTPEVGSNYRPVPEPEVPESDPVVNPVTGEVLDGNAVVTETHTVKIVTGLDGKAYPTAAPTERRTSVIDDARKAGWELRKAVERLERIQKDDRFTKNKVEILAALQPHLDFANEVISGL